MCRLPFMVLHSFRKRLSNSLFPQCAFYYSFDSNGIYEIKPFVPVERNLDLQKIQTIEELVRFYTGAIENQNYSKTKLIMYTAVYAVYTIYAVYTVYGS